MGSVAPTANSATGAPTATRFRDRYLGAADVVWDDSGGCDRGPHQSM